MYGSYEEILENKKHFHFIGIGGSGMFPLVQILHQKGCYITGSDNNETDTVEYERSVLGIPVHIGHDPANLGGADCVIYTAAVSKDNPELKAAFDSGALVLERAKMLGLISQGYHNAICVSGTHGKTTTSAMITQMLLGAGLDPSVVIGGKLPLLHGGGRVGKSDLIVCEACEFSDHFLELSPDISVILNVDADHLEYFGTLENIIRSFHKFSEKTSRTLIVNIDDPNTKKAVEGLGGKEIITFGSSDTCDYYPTNISYHPEGKTTFTLMHQKEKVAEISLSIPGRHNILNAVAAIAACLAVGAKPGDIVKSLKEFHGAGRRFEILGVKNGITIADDYAHHPTELEATLKAAKEMHFNRVWAVFQPFTFSRTKILFDDFVRVLPIADQVILAPIMGGREVNEYGIASEDLAAKMPRTVCLPSFERITEYALSHAKPGDLIITLGCGDINKCSKMMVNA
ncbi:MAG: UDP-N-acetylmuramate--L-alanine ligase [Oscillospiraceae bacterium]|nr:UDP-N-acetylmuramate--L-alanine ligase [Oscillospiraceae bacterium]